MPIKFLKMCTLVLIGSFIFFYYTLSFAQTYQYQTLAPIDGYVGTNISIGSNSLGPYLDNMFRLGIALCTVLAVLMIVIGGIQYASSDAWSKKTDGKERIIAALFGLLIALGSWVLLNTIDSRLVGTNLVLESVDIESIQTEAAFQQLTPAQQEYVRTGSNSTDSPPTTPSTPPTGTMQNIPEGITVKPGSGTKIDGSMTTGLSNMNTELAAAGINWRVTEGYPPTRVHKSDCHQKGTCIDANFVGTANSAQNVKTFIQTAQNNGFRAVYEVTTTKERDALVAAGVPSSNVKALPGWISANHFSVYNK